MDIELEFNVKIRAVAEYDLGYLDSIELYFVRGDTLILFSDEHYSLITDSMWETIKEYLRDEREDCIKTFDKCTLPNKTIKRG